MLYPSAFTIRRTPSGTSFCRRKRRRHLPYQRAQTALRRIDISASTCMLPIPPPPAVVASSSDRLVLDAQAPAM
ncbi:hypothetical protein SeLEV6574_g03232 [Synchytrium endobioticum]|uniref:Uncharacterized protein n=1 Tax=Synchytrium endobioticum TaxID=286115 RepID=A0A507D4S6_9FUNG|nr:hypothetical protein SeLEV6574_g03232 [Synchytrium endobioticum]